MDLPPADLPYLQEQFEDLVAELPEAAELDAADSAGESPLLLRDAMSQLFDLLRRIEAQGTDPDKDAREITTLGEYGMHLLSQLANAATESGQPQLARAFEHLCLPFALWLVRHGAEIRQLSPVVSALAHYANRAHRPQIMVALYTCICEITESLSPSCEAPGTNDPQHPWRLLLLNRAIVATRSHNPELMIPAFDAIVEQLPADAARFFTEGMEQISVIDYPDPVKEVIRRYFLTHARPKHLH